MVYHNSRLSLGVKTWLMAMARQGMHNLQATEAEPLAQDPPDSD